MAEELGAYSGLFLIAFLTAVLPAESEIDPPWFSVK